MNNERTVVLENISGQPIGLKDTQNRTYRFGVGGKIRISETSLQDIIDYPASKIIFNEGMVRISNIEGRVLYNMGLTEKEISKYLGENFSAADVEEEVEEPEEQVEEIEELKEEIEEIKEKLAPIEEPKVVVPAAKLTTNKKTTTTKKKSGKAKRAK